MGGTMNAKQACYRLIGIIDKVISTKRGAFS
jgi:hypothetical protein